MASGIQIDKRVMLRLIKTTPQNLKVFMDSVAEEIKTDVRVSFPAVSPSPAGGPPGIDTTALLQSINIEPVSEFGRAIHDGVLYGVVHEMGIGNHPPRPFMTPVFQDWANGKFEAAAKSFGLIK